MACFSNGSQGAYFEKECEYCQLGELPCPIAWVQVDNNYEACNNPVATKILTMTENHHSKERLANSINAWFVLVVKVNQKNN
jgi:hypothetical protein